jgi:hypothetical protein
VKKKQKTKKSVHEKRARDIERLLVKHPGLTKHEISLLLGLSYGQVSKAIFCSRRERSASRNGFIVVEMGHRYSYVVKSKSRDAWLRRRADAEKAQIPNKRICAKQSMTYAPTPDSAGILKSIEDIAWELDLIS